MRGTKIGVGLGSTAIGSGLIYAATITGPESLIIAESVFAGFFVLGAGACIYSAAADPGGQVHPANYSEGDVEDQLSQAPATRGRSERVRPQSAAPNRSASNDRERRFEAAWHNPSNPHPSQDLPQAHASNQPLSISLPRGGLDTPITAQTPQVVLQVIGEANTPADYQIDAPTPVAATDTTAHFRHTPSNTFSPGGRTIVETPNGSQIRR